MKEDAQLLCPISYEDPSDMWSMLEKEITGRFPLRAVSWRSLISNTNITIDKLPLRCLPIGASLFKDTDHPFRWFLAPYIYLQIFVCETLDAYKTAKVKLKHWVETHSGLKRSPWLIIFVPMGSQSIDTYQKIYAKISTEFCQDKTGDRSCMVLLDGFFKNNPSQTNTFSEVMHKIKDGVVLSFQQRCGQYDAEIRRLDITRNSPQFDFKQLFLVKESLALMYQMMQLPGEALVQYEELEALMDTYAPTSLPETNWPLFSTSTSAKQQPPPPPTDNDTGQRPSEGLVQSHSIESNASSSSSYIDKEIRGLWYEPAFQGDAVLTYSINHARMRVLKNKMGILELTHYVFARECFFYFGLDRASMCAEKAITFFTKAETQLKRRLESGSLMRSTQLDVVAATGEAIKLDSATLGAMIDLWAVTGVVRVARSCREYVNGNNNNSGGGGDTGPSPLPSTTASSTTGGPKFANDMLASTAPSPSRNTISSGSSKGGSGKGGRESPPRALCTLLRYAYAKLTTSLLSRPMSCLKTQRRVAGEAAMAMGSWNDIGMLVAQFPAVFRAVPERIINNNPELKNSSLSSYSNEGGISGNLRQSVIYVGSKVDNEHIEKLDDMLSLFSKSLRHMMQAAYLLQTVPRPRSGGSSSSSGSGGMTGIETAWFTAEAKLPVLESQVSVTLIRLLADHEGDAGRLRLAFQAHIDCADVLICSGRFDYARDVLLNALTIDNGILLSAGMGTLNGAGTGGGVGIGAAVGKSGSGMELTRRNSSNTGNNSGGSNTGSTNKKHSSTSSGNSSSVEKESARSLSTALESAASCSAGGIATLNYSSRVGGVWRLFRYIALRKLLLCSRVLVDARLYVDVCLRLLDPLMGELLLSPTPTTALALFKDIMLIARRNVIGVRGIEDKDNHNSSSSDGNGSSGFLSAVLPAPMYPHFSVSISFSAPTTTPTPTATTDTTTPPTTIGEGGVEGDVCCDDLEDGLKHSHIRVATMRSVTSIIHDEPFKVRYAECEAGRQHVMYLTVDSTFPSDVTLDNLMVSYIPFSLVENGQHSPIQKHSSPAIASPLALAAGGGIPFENTNDNNHSGINNKSNISNSDAGVNNNGNNIGSAFFRHHSFQTFRFEAGDHSSISNNSCTDQKDSSCSVDTTNTTTTTASSAAAGYTSSGQIDTGFECHPYASHGKIGKQGNSSSTDVPRKLVLRPGRQVVPMCFDARVVGEYAPLFVSVQIGKLVLVQRIEADVNKLHDFFSLNTLISIVSPHDPITVDVLAPPICPIGYTDSVLVGMGLEENDVISDVHVSLHSVHLDRRCIQALSLISDDGERDALISRYISLSEPTKAFQDESSGNTNSSSSSGQHPRTEALARDVHNAMHAAATTNSLTDNKMLPGTSSRAVIDPNNPPSSSTPYGDPLHYAMNGGSGSSSMYNVFVSHPEAWEVCEARGVIPPRHAVTATATPNSTTSDPTSLVASVFPENESRDFPRIDGVREVVLRVPIAAMLKPKRPLVAEGSSESSSSSSPHKVTIYMPGRDNVSVAWGEASSSNSSNGGINCCQDECFAIVCRVQGILHRNRCDTHFDRQSHTLLHCGVCVDTSQHSTGLIEQEFFHQCILRNRCHMPLHLSSVHVRAYSYDRPGTRVDLIDDGDDTTPATTPTSDNNTTDTAKDTPSHGLGAVDWARANERCLPLGGGSSSGGTTPSLNLMPGDCYFFAAKFIEHTYMNTVQHKQKNRKFISNLISDRGGGVEGSSSSSSTSSEAKPAAVSFHLGRSRAHWVTGSKWIATTTIIPTTSPLEPRYFSEFRETYDPDTFAYTVAVGSPEDTGSGGSSDGQQGYIHLPVSTTEKGKEQKGNGSGGGSPRSALVTTSSSSSSIGTVAKVKAGLPDECLVDAVLVNTTTPSTTPPTPSTLPTVYASIGRPVKVTYTIRFVHSSRSSSGGVDIAQLDKLNIMRHMLVSICETDAWLPLGSVSKSFDLRSLVELDAARSGGLRDSRSEPETLCMGVVLIPLRAGLLPLPPVQYIYSCSYFDGEVVDGLLISSQATAASPISNAVAPLPDPPISGGLDNKHTRSSSTSKPGDTQLGSPGPSSSSVGVITPTTRRKSHIMATPEQLGAALLQQQMHLLSSPLSKAGKGRSSGEESGLEQGVSVHKKGVSFDPVLAFPEGCVLVQPDGRIVVPAYDLRHLAGEQTSGDGAGTTSGPAAVLV